MEQVKEWLQCVEVGGKELIQPLEDSELQEVTLMFCSRCSFSDAYKYDVAKIKNMYAKHLRQQQKWSTWQAKNK